MGFALMNGCLLLVVCDAFQNLVVTVSARNLVIVEMVQMRASLSLVVLFLVAVVLYDQVFESCVVVRHC